ncbi:MAG: hypothetical protein IJG54_01810 [Bacteroidales bacterium]|nr:hypothetical protein [Bacteroidales bacterium]
MEIPEGTSREDIKARKKIIKDFYAKWIAEHPDKKVWNNSLKAFIHVKFLSINETVGHPSISYESTKAVLSLDSVLRNSVLRKTKQVKPNDKNQRSFSQMLFLYYNGIRLIVGKQ